MTPEPPGAAQGAGLVDRRDRALTSADGPCSILPTAPSFWSFFIRRAPPTAFSASISAPESDQFWCRCRGICGGIRTLSIASKSTVRKNVLRAAAGNSRRWSRQPLQLVGGRLELPDQQPADPLCRAEARPIDRGGDRSERHVQHARRRRRGASRDVLKLRALDHDEDHFLIRPRQCRT
jgi:hypothetical protein